jgi:hypothetical protein
VRDVEEAFPHQPMAAVSSWAEWWLQQRRREGLLRYEGGSAHFELSEGGFNGTGSTRTAAAQALLESDAETVRRVMGVHGSTGVLQTLSRCLELRPPTLIFPVADMHTCVGMSMHGAGAAAAMAAAAVAAKEEAKEEPPLAGTEEAEAEALATAERCEVSVARV